MPRDHGGFGHKNQKMSDFLGIAQKVRHFLILVPKTAIVSWHQVHANFATNTPPFMSKVIMFHGAESRGNLINKRGKNVSEWLQL